MFFEESASISSEFEPVSDQPKKIKQIRFGDAKDDWKTIDKDHRKKSVENPTQKKAGD